MDIHLEKVLTLIFVENCNEEMIDFHKPKLIVATGTSWAKFFSSVYEMKHIKTLRCETDKRNRPHNSSL